MPGSTTLGAPKRSALLSALLHVGVIAVALLFSTAPHSPIADIIPLRDSRIYAPPPFRLAHGGGGGGQRSPLPVPKGEMPKPAPRVFTMPILLQRQTPPRLEMPPEILAPAAPNLPVIDLSRIGNPAGQPGPLSGGPGTGGGLGPGNGPGAGANSGPGIGDGPGGPGIDGLPRKNATKPALLSKVEPEYSEEARKAKVQGTVVLSIVVTASGQVADVRVLRSLGLGLDERAIDAVRQWKFRPATVDGKPAAAHAQVEVNFRLL